MSKELTLLPCPACGGKADIIDEFERDGKGHVTIGWAAYCTRGCLTTSERGSREEAAALWNALPRAMTWRTEPRLGAWNWWRDEDSRIPRYVYQDGTITIAMQIDRVPYQDIGGQWCPIPEPREPTSKPPTRRITPTDRGRREGKPSKPPTRRITKMVLPLRHGGPSKPPTRRITGRPFGIVIIPTSKPPTRRITFSLTRPRARSTSKPPTRRITRAPYKNLTAFQGITFERASETSFSALFSNYLILNPFFRQLFSEATGSPE